MLWIKIRTFHLSMINIISQTVPPGRYFVYVTITANGYGQFAKSYSYFDVTKGNYNQLKKTFTTYAYTGSYEDWNKTE
jgi:hypothetical protein